MQLRPCVGVFKKTPNHPTRVCVGVCAFFGHMQVRAQRASVETGAQLAKAELSLSLLTPGKVRLCPDARLSYIL